MRISYVIITRNRRERLLKTLAWLHERTPLPAEQWEAWVVDNASTDGTADAVARRFADVRLIRRPRNEGMPARNHALREARGQYIVLLDDDSYPLGDAVRHAADYMDCYPRVGAVAGRVLLGDGTPEASALPTVMIGCATVLRREALADVGLFPGEFFRQAEEYDLSFRLWSAGWAVERFEDLVFRHDKHPGGRSSEMALRMDMRNNLILAERYLPRELRRIYRMDWHQRYTALARAAGCPIAARRGTLQSRPWAWREALAGRPRQLSAAAIERVLGLEQQALLIEVWAAAHRVRRVVIADLSKNIYATWRACRAVGLDATAIADNAPAFAGLGYRGLAVVDDAAALRTEPHGVVIANTSPARVGVREAAWHDLFPGPVLRLWTPRELTVPAPKTTQTAPPPRSAVA